MHARDRKAACPINQIDRNQYCGMDDEANPKEILEWSGVSELRMTSAIIRPLPAPSAPGERISEATFGPAVGRIRRVFAERTAC